MSNLIKWWEKLGKEIKGNMTPREKRKDDRDTRKFNRQIRRIKRKGLEADNE